MKDLGCKQDRPLTRGPDASAPPQDDGVCAAHEFLRIHGSGLIVLTLVKFLDRLTIFRSQRPSSRTFTLSQGRIFNPARNLLNLVCRPDVERPDIPT